MFSCEKDDLRLDGELSVAGFKDYVKEEEQNSCDEQFEHEGENVCIVGYIGSLNTFRDECRFHVFQSAGESGDRQEVHVTGDEDEIYDLMESHIGLPGSDQVGKFKITGEIIGKELYDMSGCFRAVIIELSEIEDFEYLD